MLAATPREEAVGGGEAVEGGEEGEAEEEDIGRGDAGTAPEESVGLGEEREDEEESLEDDPSALGGAGPPGVGVGEGEPAAADAERGEEEGEGDTIEDAGEEEGTEAEPCGDVLLMGETEAEVLPGGSTGGDEEVGDEDGVA